ncbi:50S ribosomal protein L5 [Candidatus Kaiserbacteria bacterium RIFCSPHIGHO2_01_FULL_54_36]|uniref:Large ribosomal subunit protein uL5 n=1 Tax=Candidatus Kaiserbacteria bacterium RIFCSPHIGHO2_01_FULL_54_36 TaxID=1798482 RepID=A0A1F6CJM6_9BACT|nr:MAG: 50S ribosomal protein L5 [Candidatus Kaiserbacteria bacterium RIFCSPHIGHO2_01_FULL_54_36]OGG75636.1 MAG: 50S ribosomal protein L5 [Candidatus Kaiserbacteria bacterium RIFCSPLOWO2_01_FULL_54_22]
MHVTTTPRQTTFNAMKAEFAYTNPMQAPRIQKIVISTGVGKVNKDKKRLELVEDRLARITGQHAAPRAAKKAIANFKSRTGDTVGYQVTLRGARMQAFLDKLIHIVFPRVKDFRGLKTSAIDEMGNITLGLKEHTVFPEASDEDAKDIFGLAITITTTAKNKKEAESFLRHIGLPLQTNA